MYFHRQMLASIDEAIRALPQGEYDEELSRSEWIREACRRRLADPWKDQITTALIAAKEGQP
jgi:Arc/MetJ-type ribon-helix-helix transcriptional regulator